MKSREKLMVNDNHEADTVTSKAEDLANHSKEINKKVTPALSEVEPIDLVHAKQQLKSAKKFSRGQNYDMRRIKLVVEQKTKERDEAQKVLADTQEKQNHVTSAAVKEAAQKAMTQNNRVVDDQQAVASAQAKVKQAAKDVLAAKKASQLVEPEFAKQQHIVNTADQQLKKLWSQLNDDGNNDHSDQALSLATKKVNMAKSAVSDANSDYLSKKHEQEITSKSVDQTLNAIKNAKEALASANEEVQQAERDKNKASAALSICQSDVIQKSSEVSERKQNYDKAVQAGSINQAAIHKKLKIAKAKVIDTEDRLKAQQAELSKIQSAAESAVTDKKTASAAITSATQAEKVANQHLESLQKAYNKVNNKVAKQAVPIFHFTDDQVKATQNYIEYLQSISNDAQYEMNTLIESTEFNDWQQAMNSAFEDGSKTVVSSYGTWDDEDTRDQTTEINLNQLTSSQVEELSTFTASLINQIRHDLKIDQIVGQVEATKGMASLAKEISDLTRQKPAYVTGCGHYLYALHQAAYDHGMADSKANDDEKVSSDQPNDNEILGTANSFVFDEKTTIAEAKNQIVKTIDDSLFQAKETELGNAVLIIGGLSLLAASKQDRKEYIGVSLSHSDKAMVNGEFVPIHQVHAIIYEAYQVAMYQQDGENGFYNKDRQDKKKLTIAIKNAPTDVDDDDAFNKAAIEAINQAKKDLTVKSNAVKKAQQDLQNADITLTITQKQIKQVELKIDKISQQLKKDKSDEKIAEQFANHAKDQDVVEVAKKLLDKANDEYGKAKAKLSVAKAAFSEAKENIISKQKEIPKAQNELNNSTKGLKLKQFKAYVAEQNCQIAYENLKQAKDKLDKELAEQSKIANAMSVDQTSRKQAIRHAQEMLVNAQIKLSKLQSEKLSSNVNLRKAQKNQVLYSKQLTDAQQKLTESLSKVKSLNGQYQRLSDAARAVNIAQSNLSQKQKDLEHAQEELQKSIKTSKRIEKILQKQSNGSAT